MTGPTDYDSPWKEALELYFPEFLALCFPEVFAGVDWTRGYEFLDKELQKITRDAELGRRLADKLVKVWLGDGSETWLLVHIEVQGQVDTEFARRMYTYQYRIYDHYAREVVSLAVLGDETPAWRPTEFGFARWGCELCFRFPIVKLLDYRQNWAILEASPNPFAVVVMAHLKTQETAGAMEQRAAAKRELIRGLYARGYTRQKILQLLHFIDWLLALPVELEQALWYEIQQQEEVQRMPYVTSFERLAIQKGIVNRGREDVLDALETRFAAAPEPIEQRVNQIADEQLLKSLLRQAILVKSLEDFARFLDEALAESSVEVGAEA